MTQEDATVTLDELRALEARATPGRWRRFFVGNTIDIHAPRRKPPIVAWAGFDDSGRSVAQHAANAAFIVAAVQYVRDALSVEGREAGSRDDDEEPDAALFTAMVDGGRAWVLELAAEARAERERRDAEVESTAGRALLAASRTVTLDGGELLTVIDGDVIDHIKAIEAGPAVPRGDSAADYGRTAEDEGPPTPGSWPERKTTRGAVPDAALEESRGKASESPAAGGQLGSSPAVHHDAGLRSRPSETLA